MSAEKEGKITNSSKDEKEDHAEPAPKIQRSVMIMVRWSYDLETDEFPEEEED